MRFSLSSLKNRRDSQSQTSKEYRISDFTKSLLQKQPRKSILLETSAILNENEQEEMNNSSSFLKTKKKKVRFANNTTAVIIALAANSKLSGMCWWNMQDLQAIQQIAQNQAKKLATSKEAADVSYRKALQKFYQMTNTSSSTTNTTNTTTITSSSSDASILEASFARDLRRRLHNSQSRSGLEYQVLEHMGIALSKHRQTVLQKVLKFQHEYSMSTNGQSNNTTNKNNSMMQQHLALSLRKHLEPFTVASKVRAREMALLQRPLPEKIDDNDNNNKAW